MKFEFKTGPVDREVQPSDRPVVYTIQELADALKTSRASITKLIHAGIIHGLKLGSMKVPAKEVERFLSEYTGKDVTDPENVVDI